jgi:hypothetical protein
MDMNMNMNHSDTSLYYTGDDPWYLRTLPGRTGDFMGHFVPALCFGGLGLGLLLLALYRARQLPPNTNKSFSELHIPECDPLFLRWFGWVTMAGTCVGIFYEILDKDPGYDSIALTHSTLYISFFIMGVCALYESKGKLPLDTHRAALVLACIVQSLIWHAHGTMKKMPEDAMLHILLSWINIANAAVVAYSMRYVDSVIAYLAGWALLVLQGMWIFVAGLYECCIDLHMHDIATLLALFCLAIFLAVVLVVVHYGPDISDQEKPQFRGNFAVLSEVDEKETYDSDPGP